MNAVSKHQVIPRFYSWQKSINLWTGSEAQGVDHASLPENNSENLMKSYPHIHSNPQKKEEKEKRSKKEKEERKMMTTSFSTPTAYFQYMRGEGYVKSRPHVGRCRVHDLNSAVTNIVFVAFAL